MPSKASVLDFWWRWVRVFCLSCRLVPAHLIRGTSGSDVGKKQTAVDSRTPKHSVTVAIRHVVSCLDSFHTSGFGGIPPAYVFLGYLSVPTCPRHTLEGLAKVGKVLFCCSTHRRVLHCFARFLALTVRKPGRGSLSRVQEASCARRPMLFYVSTSSVKGVRSSPGRAACISTLAIGRGSRF